MKESFDEKLEYRYNRYISNNKTRNWAYRVEAYQSFYPCAKFYFMV